ncbi:MAG: hypothetical protein ACRDHY_00400 [Anaerolineales bacterium]
MSHPRGATALQRIEVVVSCENCSQEYSYTHDLLGAARSLYGLPSRAEAEKRLAVQVERVRSGVLIDLPPHPCPACGAVQSWMAPSARRQAAERWGCGTSAVAASLGLIGLAAAGRLTFDLLLVGGVVLAALAMGAVADRLARRRWRPPVRLPGPESARQPEIRFV